MGFSGPIDTILNGTDINRSCHRHFPCLIATLIAPTGTAGGDGGVGGAGGGAGGGALRHVPQVEDAAAGEGGVCRRLQQLQEILRRRRGAAVLIRRAQPRPSAQTAGE